MSLIELKNVSQAFRNNGEKKIVLDKINLTVDSGDFINLQGSNGSGKSTLLNLILGLQQPDLGQISVFGHSPNKAESRMRLGCVLQKTQVPSYLTVRELIDLVRSYYPYPLTTDEILKRAHLQALQHNKVNILAGGQQQLLYFALAIAGDPDLLILDEPTTNLAEEYKASVLQCFKEFAIQNKAVLFITHNSDDRKILADVITRTLKLENGKLEEIQTDHQKEAVQQNPLLTQPPSSFLWLKALLGQFKVELLGLIRNPIQLLSILLFYIGGCFIPFFLQQNNFKDPALPLLLLTGFSAFNIVFTSIDKFGVRLAAERSSGWVRLLRVRPLPPAIYLGAKTLVVLMISAIGVGMMFTVAHIRLDITASLMEWVRLFGVLLFGGIPFAIIGCVIGYLFTEISVSMMSILMLALFALTSLPFQKMGNWLNWIPFSPFYHYAQLLQWAIPVNISLSDEVAQSSPNLLLSLTWLIWTGLVSSLVAIWAYRRDPKVARP